MTTQTRNTTSLNWRIADDVDAAFSLGKADATDGARRDSTLYTDMGPAYMAYNVGYNEGLRLLVQMGEPVSAGLLAEAAWFDEICGVDVPQSAGELTDADLDALFAGDYSNVEPAEYREDWVGA